MGPPFIGYMADVFTSSYLALVSAPEILTAKCSFVDDSLSQVLRTSCMDAKAYGMKIACLITVMFYLLAAVVFLASTRFLKKDIVQG